jgi:hypothetical protein
MQLIEEHMIQLIGIYFLETIIVPSSHFHLRADVCVRIIDNTQTEPLSYLVSHIYKRSALVITAHLDRYFHVRFQR